MVAQPGQVLLDFAQLDAPRLGVEQVHGDQLGARDHALGTDRCPTRPSRPRNAGCAARTAIRGPWSGVVYPAESPKSAVSQCYKAIARLKTSASCEHKWHK